MFLIGEVISATAKKSTVEAAVGSNNYLYLCSLNKTANFFSTQQG